MLKGIVKLFGGDTHKRTMEALFPLVDEVNALEPEFEKLTDEELRAKTDEFRQRLLPTLGGTEGGSESLDDLLPEAFASVREASKRTLRLRHYDVQIIGGAVLHRGEIAEMRTGEGKTLVATLPLYLNALTGKGVHLVTVNDYLARRDARWMGPIYHFLGLSVGILQMAAVTENGKKAFLYDPEKESPHEDQHMLRMVDRAEAYAADITYGTNSEFGFDYLRDNMAMRLSDRVQRKHYYAIVDEVDNVLIDEARTPLIISGPASGELDWYGKMAQLVKQLKPEDYEVNEKDRSIALTEVGIAHVEGLLGQPLQDPDRPEDVSPEQARLMGYLEQALRAQHLFRRNREYLVQGGKVIIVDENTGRLMPGRRWSDGLHQAVEAKEGVRIEPESVTYATVTLQNYFRMYEKLAGMTGTALTEAEEFSKIYKLEVTPIITNLEYQASRNDAPLVEVKSKDDEGYPVVYFSRREDKKETPLYWRRKDYPDVIYRTGEMKLRAVVQEIARYNAMGRPLLIGTTSVENSDSLSTRLRADPVRRLLQVLLIRQLWFEKNKREEDGRLIAELEPLYQPLEKLDPSFLRKFAAPLGLTSINLEEPENLSRLLGILSLDEEHAPRLKAILSAGIQHKVLNARKHTEESLIIAGAGAFGAVTIATSMAGRGVDIKLGGEIGETDVSFTKDFLQTVGAANPFGMTNAEALQALLAYIVRDENFGFSANGNPMEFFARVRAALVEKYGRPGADDWSQLSNILYTKLGIGLKASESLAAFWSHTEQERIVRALGGLAVIATERHDARRIDNQLRGRAARQGDPGSSRFYLSMEDDLMRIQGGQQVSAMMERLKVDDAFPLEARVVSNLIEQSQHRVEGANFDVRKHLLEYDDVLNKQRTQIYEQRDRIFTKEILRDDVQEMLEAEVRKRVETAFADEEGPWRLLAWLDQVQPPFPVGEAGLFPSFTLKIILDEFASQADPQAASVHLADRALEIEHGHTLRAIESAVARASEALDKQIAEREDLLDTFFAGLRDSEEPRKFQHILEELQSLVRVPIKLDNSQQRALVSDPESLKDEIGGMISDQLVDVSVTRLIGAVENRIGESLGISKGDVTESSWDDLAALVNERSQAALERQRERLVGSGGQIARDAEALIQREPLTSDAARLRMLLSLSQGVRNAFDAKTHRPVKQVYQRFGYSFLAAESLAKRDTETVIEEILVHLEQAEENLASVWGKEELQRRGDPPGGQGEAKEKEAGLRLLNEAHRRLLLSAITELWVDYLTRIEALRVSIGLEAYAQRDPLVQYKSRASEMFQALLEDIRAVVIGRLFAHQRRPTVAVFEDAAQEQTPSAAAEAASTGGKKKRKRH
ncbi:MAG: Protein translocase subunit SecA [Anaerolineales bacterium]|nr:Protein translocase subunit SecA [Anaerolineales bacterium]